jgi:DNA polymerase III alpha subunit (gram-positive type)
MAALLFDCETDGLLDRVSTIHCIGILDVASGDYRHYVGDDLYTAFVRLSDADVIIGHNIRQFDCEVISYLTEGLVRFDQDRIIDTLEMSRMLMPGLGSHALRRYGDMLGFPKLYMKEFSKLTPQMLLYMERDVRLNFKVYKMLASLL